MSWSIVEVARMSGVTSRTLRHYDEIGLLPAAGVRSNGYRYYEADDLLRLQQIRVLRELDLGLAEIQTILDQQSDQVEALRGHHARLLRERDRLTLVADTVARTIAELKEHEGETTVSNIARPENLFDGFDPTEYDEEAQERWPEQWQESKNRTASMTPQDIEQLQREQTAAMIRMAELMAAKTPVDDPVVQVEIDAAYRTISRMWTPDATAFRCLGEMYVDDPRFTATYDKVAKGLAGYYRDAMAVYADTVLAQ
ncbi:MerR family transcriptional regulator [Williamsia soli]|uniref:MerR family transcriptional regulator n=1 Tax=Williamsia soli TaxID=364929 RepID=UPI001A9F7821|nr:MerR family transcriptional regulator [Williamsia soli]